MGEHEQQETVGPGHEQTKKGRRRLLAAYAIIGLGALIAIVVIILLSSGSDSAARGNPHINLESGITNGIAPDSRVGIEPLGLANQSLQEAAKEADCELRLGLPVEGRDHIPSGAPEPRYKTNPPTSGDHLEDQQADGAYRGTPPPGSVVHSLEHGRLAIQYRPDLSERAQLELIGLFDTAYGGTLLFPNPDMPYAVVATTWTNLLGCRSYHGALTLAATRAFGRATWGKFGGEPVIAITPASPTPARPLHN